MAKIYNEEINKHTDWGGDESTSNLPVSGYRIQEFIKKQLNSKAGVFYYDSSNNRYIVFADTETRDQYLENPTQTELIIGTFDAPFNYNAEINLISDAYKAVQLNSIGNYIEFTFDIKNKQGASTGENVNITYTFIRNSSKKIVIEAHKHGESIRFNIDNYLGEGTNNIIITVTGQTTLASVSASITYQVINLSLIDEMNISKIYPLTLSNTTIEIPYTISGYGTKTIEWYVDNNKIEFIKDEDEIVDVTSTRTKYINLTHLVQGVHNLQYRAYTIVNGDKFYTDVLYRDFFVSSITKEDKVYLGIATTLKEISDSITLELEQYNPFTLRVASFSTDSTSANITVNLGDKLITTLISQNNEENTITITPETYGKSILSLNVNTETKNQYAVNIKKTSMNIDVITSNLEFEFNAEGKSNNMSDKDTWSYKNYTGKLQGFSWNNNSGWVNNRLVFSENSSFTIDYKPLSSNSIVTGKTIEIEFSTLNVKNDNAIICDLRDSNGTGLLITATKVSLISSGGTIIETQYKSGENVRITFVINKNSGTANKCLSFIYTNGIIARGDKRSIQDDYLSERQLKFQSSNEAQLSLKQIRVYNTALTSDQILNNYIIYRDSIDDMISVYDRNNIYIEGTTTFNTDKMSNRLPVMIITGDIPTLENTSNKNTQIIADIEYTNMQDPTRNFKMVGAAMRPQGTSSMGYPKKNFRIYTKKLDTTVVYDYNNKIIEDKLYSFKENSIPVNTWCLKADYAESSGTHNTGIARLWNDALYNVQLNGEYICRTEAQKKALLNNYEYDVRTAIDGFPILLFYRKNKEDDLIFIGKYNFNNDKSTESVFGFKDIPGFDNSKMQCWEVLNNGNSIALFNSVDDFDNKWSDAFESRYPDTSTPNITDLKNFCTWITNVTQEDFKTQKWEHLNVYMMAAYYIYLIRYAAVDQFVKNAMLTSEDGVHFYYILYDNDTINGIVNSGKLGVLPTDDRQTTDESGAYIFAGHDSKLWNTLEADKEFMLIVKKVDNALYSAGISYLNSIRIFDEEQADKWIEKVYNQDAQYKYIGPYTDSGIDNLFMLQGKRDLHRKWWLNKRFSIYDAKFVTGPYKSQAIEFKCINGTPVGQKFTITAYQPLEYGYGINDEPRVTNVKLNSGESQQFTTDEVLNLGDPIRVYGAANLKAINLSEMSSNLATINVTNAYNDSMGTCLTNLTLGGTKVNKEVSEISGLSRLYKLEYLNINNFQNITFLDLTNQIYLKELQAQGSKLTSVTLAKDCPLIKLTLPNTLNSLILEGLTKLSYSNINIAGYKSISNITIKNCPNVSNNFEFINNWLTSKITENSKCTLIINNISWNNISPEQLISLGTIGTLDLAGTVTTTEITEEQLSKLISIYGEDIFEDSAKLHIIAPPSIYILGKTTLKEGESQRYSCVVVGQTLLKYSMSAQYILGNSSYMKFTDGLLEISEGYGNGSIKITATVITDKSTTTKELNVSIRALQYPNSSNSIFTGDEYLQESGIYTLKLSDNIDGSFSTQWSLTGLDGYAEIDSSDLLTCTLSRINIPTTVVSGTLSLAIIKNYNNSKYTTLTKTIRLQNEDIAESDVNVCRAIHAAGLCANENYITKDEAKLITADDLQPGISSTTNIFYNYLRYQSPSSFDGFKYFTSVLTYKPYMLAEHDYKKLTFPTSITTMIGARTVSAAQLTLNEGLTYGNNITLGDFRYDKITDRYIVIPSTMTYCDGSLLIDDRYTLTIKGGNALTNDISIGIKNSTYDRNELVKNNLFIESNNLKMIEAENKFIAGYSKVTTKELPTTITLPSGGYFEDMTNTQNAIIEEHHTNVYFIKNKVAFVTLKISANLSEAIPTIEYTNTQGETVTVTGVLGENILPIKYGTIITVTVSDIDNYATPSRKTIEVDNVYTTLSTFQYAEQCNLYIQHIDGTLYTKEQWTENAFSNDKANGVAVVRPISNSFIVAKNRSNEKYAWGGYYMQVSGVATYWEKAEALLDNNGESNTDNMIERLKDYTDEDHKITGAPAAEACRAFIFPDGKTKGYLGGAGEYAAIFNNKSAISDLSVLIGGDNIEDYDIYSSVQTSTQKSMDKNWYYHVSYAAENVEKYSSIQILPLGKLTLKS